MTDQTPIKDIPTTYICADCQQAALDEAAKDTASLEGVLAQYCETHQRGLTLFTVNGQPARWMVSEPGTAKRFWANYRARLEYVKNRLYEIQAAEAEGHEGALH